MVCAVYLMTIADFITSLHTALLFYSLYVEGLTYWVDWKLNTRSSKGTDTQEKGLLLE